jgi:hypothetical protein
VSEEAPKRSKAAKTDDAPSAADLEFVSAPPGPEIEVQRNAERPWEEPTTVAGPPELTVTVTDGDGNEVETNLSPGDESLITSRALASKTSHPGLAPDYSNPALKDMTDEEREADQKEYASRVS